MARLSVLFVLALSASASALRLSSSAASSNVSSTLKCSPQTPELPAELRTVGVQVFGSAEKLAAFAAKVKGPCKLTAEGVDMLMVQSADDESGIPFLQDELANRYHPNGVSEVDAEEGLLVDVGMNLGDTAIIFSKKKPKMQVIAFEPVPPTYFLAVWNLHLNGVPTLSKEDIGKANKPGVLALNEAVGDGRDLKMKWFPGWSIGATMGEDMSGATPRSRRGREHKEDEKPETRMVHTVELPSFLASRGIQSVELLKVDCEGCEFFVMPQMKESILNKQKVKHFAFEIHPEHCPNKDRKKEMSEIMTTRGCGQYEEKEKVYLC